MNQVGLLIKTKFQVISGRLRARKILRKIEIQQNPESQPSRLVRMWQTGADLLSLYQLLS